MATFSTVNHLKSVHVFQLRQCVGAEHLFNGEKRTLDNIVISQELSGPEIQIRQGGKKHFPFSSSIECCLRS